MDCLSAPRPLAAALSEVVTEFPSAVDPLAVVLHHHLSEADMAPNLSVPEDTVPNIKFPCVAS